MDYRITTTNDIGSFRNDVCMILKQPLSKWKSFVSFIEFRKEIPKIP